MQNSNTVTCKRVLYKVCIRSPASKKIKDVTSFYEFMNYDFMNYHTMNLKMLELFLL